MGSNHSKTQRPMTYIQRPGQYGQTEDEVVNSLPNVEDSSRYRYLPPSMISDSNVLMARSKRKTCTSNPENTSPSVVGLRSSPGVEDLLDIELPMAMDADVSSDDANGSVNEDCGVEIDIDDISVSKKSRRKPVEKREYFFNKGRKEDVTASADNDSYNNLLIDDSRSCEGVEATKPTNEGGNTAEPKDWKVWPIESQEQKYQDDQFLEILKETPTRACHSKKYSDNKVFKEQDLAPLKQEQSSEGIRKQLYLQGIIADEASETDSKEDLWDKSFIRECAESRLERPSHVRLPPIKSLDKLAFANKRFGFRQRGCSTAKVNGCERSDHEEKGSQQLKTDKILHKIDTLDLV
ncbi:hypothetical protein LOTGIDRAFT_155202 [Lottia gigantea]|uniref:Uncharacterized protein n=1 Tax=Lottia gigantea TaxID=225164 RepID=V4B9Q8_LOTGI|nr:hypothetical protein LOTGIDRAFT_155202 [Lottia gigantea]ESO85709.1 hypothetical protein LOTGIDRAFT_155202 [Lottia gigantea]